ncbi:MAG: hypothetical protein K2O03_03640 [Lachnospiraceae bacterium]|nr:hypothetical protein [Lachnospiraceae bacterium]
MAGYMVYWPQDRVQELKRAKDNGPIKVVFGSVHARMPAITSVKVGDIVFPVALLKKKFCVMARLPVEHREPAYDYLVRELGNSCSAIVPEGVDWKLYYDKPLLPHLAHQEPFNCCSKWAVWGGKGSAITPRELPDEVLPELRFGYPKSKEKGLRFDEKGNVMTNCLTVTRRLSEETLGIFEALFEEG